MNKYPLIRSTLEGIFGAQVGLDEVASAEALRRDLQHAPFRDGIQRELSQAFADSGLSWKALLDECDVACFESEDEARDFVTANILNVVNSPVG